MRTIRIWLMASALAMAVALAGTLLGTAPRAAADPAGPHGGYDLLTNKCAACHRAHTAVGEDLLKEESITALCLSCHNGAGPSDANVVDGKDLDGGAGGLARLNGGAFRRTWFYDDGLGGCEDQNADSDSDTLPNPADPDCWSIENVQSRHEIEATGTAWGSAPGTAGGVSGRLECTSCHNPHGSGNYRILKDSENGYPYRGSSSWPAAHRWVANDPELLDWRNTQVVLNGTDDYSAGDTAPYTGNLMLGAGYGKPGSPYMGMSGFCGNCHKQYLTNSGSGEVPSAAQGYEENRSITTCYDGVDNDGDTVVDWADTDCQSVEPFRFYEPQQNPVTCTDAVDNDDDGLVDSNDPDCESSLVAAKYWFPGTQDAQDGHGDVARFRHAMLRSYTGSPDLPLRRAEYATLTTGEDGSDPLTCADGIDNDGDGTDEDPVGDANSDGKPGVSGVDDDLDGKIDEGKVADDDEDGLVDEDPGDSVDNDNDAWGHTDSNDPDCRVALASYSSSGFTCLTCHFAHGSPATATGYSVVDPTNDSALLYYDERGVCRACHQKGK